MKTAVIMAGLLGCYQVSVDSIMQNLVIPYDADVFVLTSNGNYVHASNENDFEPGIQPTPVSSCDEDAIKACFGGHLRHFSYSEDIPGYQDDLEQQQFKLKERLASVENRHGDAYFDPNTQTIRHPIWYLDQFLRLKYLIQKVSGYDMVVRYRIDQILTRPLPLCSIEDGAFWWSGMDNLFYGDQTTMNRVCSNFLDNIGAYSPPEHIGPVNGLRYGLSSDAQFGGYIKITGLNAKQTQTNFGWRLHKRDAICNIFSREKTEIERQAKGLSPKDFYIFEKREIPYSPVFDTEHDILWAYFLY